MAVLITGGAGFLGSHLAEELVSQGEEVIAVDDLSRGSKKNISSILDKPGFEFVKADLRKPSIAENLLAKSEKVYHLAAKIGGVGYLRDKPADIISDNDKINKNVFDAAVKHNVDRLVFASSSMLYSEDPELPSKEEAIGEIPPPRGSYGFQKLNGEYYCDAYARQYGLEYSSVRIFNGVGPRDWPEDEVGHGHVIPDMVKKIVELEQNPVKVKGSGKQTRCFTDVRDLVSGMILCMEEDEAKNKAFNLGSSERCSVRELVEKIWDLSDREGNLGIDTEDSFDKDIKHRAPDNSKAREVLGWEVKHSLDDMLENYISAFKEEFMDGT